MITDSIKKIKTLGFKGLSRKLCDASSKKLFHLKWKSKAMRYQANHTWKQIEHQYRLENFTSIRTHIAMHDMVKKIRASKQFKKITPQEDPKNTILQADQLTNNQFDILGSGATTLSNDIPWQSDIKLSSTKQPHVKTKYFADISVDIKKVKTLDDYNFDIKMPWELSRMHHLYTLGLAYEMSSNQEYVKTITTHLDSWIANNTFLLGINWFSAMDVAMRAINIMWGIHFLQYNKNIPEKWWQKVIASLYDHLIYLKSNMLHATRPNNHFLAELLGYAYLCHFFSFIPIYQNELSKTRKILDQQFNLQIQPDGTSYEGSTAYHRLDTELYLHASFLGCKSDKLKKMIMFIQDCHDKKNNFIQIGDNDSARLVTGLYIKPNTQNKIVTYQNFGLSIIKHEDWHISFRHPTYQLLQPSGHFHHDQLAVTVSIAGVPILVDPGSYLYTANPNARNTFRSYKSHNTFTASDFSEQELFTQLFELPRAEQLHCSQVTEKDNDITIHDSYTLDQTFHRKLIFDMQRKSLTIHDALNPQENTPCIWALNFAPEITLHYDKRSTSWNVFYQDTLIAKLCSTIPFSCAQSLYSTRYGTKQSCTKLIGTTVGSSKPTTIQLTQAIL